MKELVSHGINREELICSLDANNHDNLTTSYYLLLKKHLKEGGQSKADINSEIFDVSLIEPKKNADQKDHQNYLNKLIRDVKNTSEKKKLDKSSSNHNKHTLNSPFRVMAEEEELANTEKKGSG